MRPIPRNPSDAASVAVDGSDITPSTPCVAPVFTFAFASPRAATFVSAVSRSGDPALPAAADVPPHGEVRFASGLVLAIADPLRHDEPPGLVSFAPASDGAANVDGVAPPGSLQALLI